MSYTVSVANRAEYISFNSKSSDQRARYLSNFIGCEITIPFQTGEILTFPTAEHAFQASKFYLNGYYDYARTFTNKTMSPVDAKKTGKSLRLNEEQLKLWASLVKDVQIFICWEKIKNTPELKEYLISTDGFYLLHHEAFGKWSEYGGVFLEKSPYGDNRLWLKGNNLLGVIWMGIRNNIISNNKDNFINLVLSL